MSLLDLAGEPEHLPGAALSGKAEFVQIQQEKTVRRMHESVQDWKLPELPDLSRFDDVIIDLETNGLRWWDGDRMIGAGIRTPDGVRRYLPIRHKVGPNIPEERFFEWVKRELRGKKVTNIRTKFDLHMFRAEGCDLEQQGCTFGDVAHYAALLDDHRRLFNQEALVEAYLLDKSLPPGMEGKIREVNGFTIDPAKFAEYPAGLVAPRAEGDVEMVHLLREVMWPLMTEQNLHVVRDLEEKIIPVVVEMEHNGVPLDLEKLNRWIGETWKIYEDCLWEIKKATGIMMTSATKRDEIMRLFSFLNIEHPLDPDSGNPTIADDFLKPVTHPVIQTLRKAIAFKSLNTKLVKYNRGATARDGILRYELHQLPYQDDEEGGGGAVSGRFSSAAPSRDEGANIQQVFGVGTQEEETRQPDGTKVKIGFTKDYLVKSLFVPDRRVHKLAQWLKADASQFQFRLFAHYGNSPMLIEAYKRDNNWREIARMAAEAEAAGLPITKDLRLTDFHEAVQELIFEYAHKELSRTHTKNVNFAQVFAAGIRKMASQLGVPADQIPSREESIETGGPLFQEVVRLSATYHSMFPEVKPLLALTSHMASPGHKTGKYKCGRACRDLYRQGYRHRGWVRTFLGRRARFGPNDRDYSALNRVIQGTEGDVAKRIMIEVHNLRYELGITERFVVHDELDCDLHDPGNREKFVEVLNTQYYDFRVPILWETKMGPTWAEAK